MRGVNSKAPVFTNSLAVYFGHVRGENEDEFKTQSLNALNFRISNYLRNIIKIKNFKRSNFELSKERYQG